MDNKANYIRQSNLVHYPTCPYKYALSRIYDIETSEPMREGLLFELYLLGCKPDKEFAVYEKELRGRKRTETIDKIKGLADFMRPYLGEGESFVEYILERGEGLLPLRGEIDRIGLVRHEGDWIRALIDVKKTSNLETIWNRKTSKFEFLQSVVYPYLHYKKTGELLPFVYLILEDEFEDDPMIKTILVNTDQEAFDWFERFLAQVDNDLFLNANVSELTCYQYNGKARCNYFKHCDPAKEYFGGSSTINFGELQ